MSESTTFEIIRPGRPPKESAAALGARVVPKELRSHAAAAADYIASDELVDALNTALAVGSPLLITGDPGTGKTQAAYYAARQLGVPEVFKLDVNSQTQATDLFYDFDRVGYFHEASVNRDPKIDVTPHLKRGPLWRAFDEIHAGRSAVVLIDEIDKAPREFPNGLLNALDQYQFKVPVLNVQKEGDPSRPPLIVITSNNEQRLPEPLLRRCIYFYIQFDEQHVRGIVERRCQGFPNLDHELRTLAFQRFLDIRSQPLRKKPATAELLVWLTVLSARRSVDLAQLRRPLAKLPALFCLVKDRDDLERLA